MVYPLTNQPSQIVPLYPHYTGDRDLLSTIITKLNDPIVKLNKIRELLKNAEGNS